MTVESAKYWMGKALQLASEAATRNEVPVGALLVREGEIIGQGANAREHKTRTIAHGEILALEDYNRRCHRWRVFPDTSIFVTVEPCLMCTGALLWARVDHIYFGCPDPKHAGIRRVQNLIEEGVYDHRFKTIQGGLLAEQCSSLMSGYFSQMRREKRQTISETVSTDLL